MLGAGGVVLRQSRHWPPTRTRTARHVRQMPIAGLLCFMCIRADLKLARTGLRVRHFRHAREAKPAQGPAGLGDESLSFGARPPAE